MQQSGFWFGFWLFFQAYSLLMLYIITKKSKANETQVPLKSIILHLSSKSKGRPGILRFLFKQIGHEHPQGTNSDDNIMRQ